MYREEHSRVKETTKTVEWAKHKKALNISETVSVTRDWPMQPSCPMGTTRAASGKKSRPDVLCGSCGRCCVKCCCPIVSYSLVPASLLLATPETAFGGGVAAPSVVQLLRHKIESSNAMITH